MNKFFKNISFTKSEIQVISFVLIVVTSGFAVKYYKQVFALNSEIIFDYSEPDRKFRELSGKAGKDIQSVENDSSLRNKGSIENTDTPEKVLSAKIQTSEDSLLQNMKVKNENTSINEDIEIVNINTASKEELIDLPGIGESTAEKILKYREEKKGFKRTEDLMNVKGIGKKKFESIKNHIKTD